MKIAKFFLAFIVAALPFVAHAVEVERVISPGGVEAWLVQDHANPVVSMSFAFRGGSERDPKDKTGLANLAASTMDEGAGDLPSQAFQQRLADQAIDLRFQASFDTFSGRVRTLSKNVDEAFRLLRLALSHPRFDDEPVARLKGQIQSALRQSRESPGTVAYQALFKGFFPGHGYGQRAKGTVENVAAITRQDLLDFVKSRIVRRGLKIGVVGDVTPQRLGVLLDRTFAALPVESKEKPVSEMHAQARGRVTVIPKDVVQSTIMFGHGGPRRNDPDFYAAMVMNHILAGGTFTSRLYTQVREKRGLAYSVSAGLYPLDKAGIIIGSAGTANARVGETIKVIRAEWARMAEGEISQKDVDIAKTYLIGSYPLRLTSTMAVARVLVAMQHNVLGIDYLDKRAAYLQAVTLDDVKRVAAKYLDVSKLDMVVVGKPEGVVSRP